MFFKCTNRLKKRCILKWWLTEKFEYPRSCLWMWQFGQIIQATLTFRPLISSHDSIKSSVLCFYCVTLRSELFTCQFVEKQSVLVLLNFHVFLCYDNPIFMSNPSRMSLKYKLVRLQTLAVLRELNICYPRYGNTITRWICAVSAVRKDHSALKTRKQSSGTRGVTLWLRNKRR